MRSPLFGVLYVGWLSAHLVLLRELPWRAGTPYADGASYVFLAFFVTWSCDTGAYAVGRVFGRTRPWTRDLAAQVGGGRDRRLRCCAIAAAFVARALVRAVPRRWDALRLGAAGRRVRAGRATSSSRCSSATRSTATRPICIPGHGGVLDRFDSLYFAAPIVYYYLRLVVFRVP